MEYLTWQSNGLRDILQEMINKRFNKTNDQQMQ